MVEGVACSDLEDLRVTRSGHCGERIFCRLGKDAARVVPWRPSVRFDTTSGVDRSEEAVHAETSARAS